MSGFIPAPAKFRPRGLCTDLDDTSLPDGYYPFRRTASGVPCSMATTTYGAMTLETVNDSGNGVLYRVQTAFVGNYASYDVRWFVRVWRRSNLGVWTSSSWDSESTEWDIPSLGTNWTRNNVFGYGGFAGFRRVQRRVDLLLTINADGGTPGATLLTLPAGYRPENSFVTHGLVLDAGFNVPVRIQVNSDGTVVDLTTPAVGETLFFNTSFIALV